MSVLWEDYYFLAGIDRQAEDMFFRLVEQYAAAVSCYY
ncbi:TnpV protein [Murimonas intestini]|nr:TnpV protein [Murimonas intestini]